jgi:Flp pilus assembly protein TadD
MTTPDAYLLEQLGNVLNKLRRTDKARAAWQRSYEITPTEPLRLKLHSVKKEG